MRSFREDQLRDVIAATGLKQGDLVMVHSALFSLGRIEGVPIKEIPSRLYRALRHQLGSKATIVVPTFNFDFCRGDEFDRQHTASAGMGAFSEYVRCLPEAKRSPHPLQSMAAVGPLADDLSSRDTKGAFEETSSFDALVEYDAHILLIGCGINAVSLVHWAEERARVPYRFWKDFTAAYRDDGEVSVQTYRMYARDLERDPTVNLEPIGRILRRRSELRRLSLGQGCIQSCRARDFVAAALQLLHRDPNALIRYPPGDHQIRRTHASQ